MTKPIIWRIRVEREGNKLRIPKHTQIPLRATDSVVWVFDFEIDGQTPALLLSKKSGEVVRGPFGPFTMLNYAQPVLRPSISPDDHRYRIFASGFGGDCRQLTYRVGLLDNERGEPLITSNEGYLEFISEAEESVAPQQVTVSMELSGLHRDHEFAAVLRVTPKRVAITPGAPVVWSFVIPSNLFGDVTWYPEIVFPHTAYGPFQSIAAVVEPAFADQVLERNIKLIGTGDNGLRGSFNYLCRVRSSDGVFAVSSADPTIDDEGEVQTPPDLGG